MDDCDWNELSVVVLTVFLKVSTLILMLRFIFHLWINRAYHTEYVRVIEWFMDKYLLMIGKESIVFQLKVNITSFMEGLWKDTTKSNLNFGEFAKLRI